MNLGTLKFKLEKTFLVLSKTQHSSTVSVGPISTLSLKRYPYKNRHHSLILNRLDLAWTPIVSRHTSKRALQFSPLDFEEVSRFCSRI